MRVKVKAGVSAKAMGLSGVAYNKSNPPKSIEDRTEREAIGSMSEKVFFVLSILKHFANAVKVNVTLQPALAMLLR